MHNTLEWFGLVELFELVNYGYVMDFVNWTCETFELRTVMLVYIVFVCLWMVVRFEFEFELYIRCCGQIWIQI
jgi:hypothetical protein